MVDGQIGGVNGTLAVSRAWIPISRPPLFGRMSTQSDEHFPGAVRQPLLAPKYLAELETQVVMDRVDGRNILQVVQPDVSLTTPQGPAGPLCLPWPWPSLCRCGYGCR